MKKLFAILTGAALIAGCHSRDASTGGTYDETRSMTGGTGTSPGVTQPSDNSQGSSGTSLNNNSSKPADTGTSNSSNTQNPNTEPSDKSDKTQ